MKSYAKVIYSIPPSVWTPIVAPIDCNDFWIKCRDNDDMRECTDDDPTPSSPYDLIPGNVMQFLPAYTRYGGAQVTRFLAGDTITHLMPDTDTACTCVVTFVA